MFSAHHLIMIYMCTKLRENISKGSRVSGTDRWMDKVITKGPPQTSSGGTLIRIQMPWEKGSISSSLLSDPIKFCVYCTCCYFGNKILLKPRNKHLLKQSQQLFLKC